MNRDAIYSKFLDLEAWNSSDAVGQKEAVEAIIEALIAELDQCNIQPDGWEASNIAAALSALQDGYTRLALNCVALALEPPDRRAKMWLCEPHTPTIDQLRRRLAEVSGFPGRN